MRNCSPTQGDRARVMAEIRIWMTSRRRWDDRAVLIFSILPKIYRRYNGDEKVYSYELMNEINAAMRDRRIGDTFPPPVTSAADV